MVNISAGEDTAKQVVRKSPGVTERKANPAIVFDSLASNEM
jgi:hypothetical protein